MPGWNASPYGLRSPRATILRSLPSGLTERTVALRGSFSTTDVAGRAAAQVQAPVAAEDDVVLLVLAERQTAHDDAMVAKRRPAQDESAEPALLRDEQRPPAPDEAERRAQSARDDDRLPRPARRDHEQPGVLGHVQAAVRPPRHRGRVVEAGGERRHAVAGRNDDLHRRRARGGREQRGRDDDRGQASADAHAHVAARPRGTEPDRRRSAPCSRARRSSTSSRSTRSRTRSYGRRSFHTQDRGRRAAASGRPAPRQSRGRRCSGTSCSSSRSRAR